MIRPIRHARLDVSAASRPLAPRPAPRRALPYRPYTRGALTRPQNVEQQIPSARRQFSLFPWRRAKDLPVYFPEVSRTDYRGKLKTIRQTLQRLISTCVVLYACAAIYIVVVLNPLLDFLEQEYEALSEEEKKMVDQEADEDDGFFLPLPFTRKLVQGPPYKSTDPEWDMFLKINEDRKLQNQIRASLAAILTKQIAKEPRFTAILGGPNIKPTRMWLDILYPPAPPPHYEVSGIILTDDAIIWGTREVDSATGSRLGRVLEPKAAALGIWAFVSTLLRQTARDVAEYVGLKQEPPPDTTWQVSAMRRMIDQGGMGGAKNQAGRGTTQAGDKSQDVPGPGQEGDLNSLTGGPYSHLGPRARAATMAGAQEFMKAIKSTEQPLPRGCIKVGGMLEIRGKKAVMAIYVRAGYDPARQQFVVINSFVKHVRGHKQSPAA